MFTGVLEELVELPDQALDDRIRQLELERRRLDAGVDGAHTGADRLAHLG